MKSLLLLALIALFFKAYAVEADIRLLAFYPHLPDQEGVRFLWDELAKTRPEDFPRRVASFSWLDFLSGTKKKEFELFWLTFSHAGRLSACVPKWRPFFNGYTREKGLEFDLPNYALKRGHGLLFSLGSPLFTYLLSLVWNHHHYTFIVGLAAGLAILPSRRLECSLPAEDRNVSNSVLHTGKWKQNSFGSSHMFNLFLAVSPEIFIINATFILLIHGVVFSTSKKYDYPPLVSNVGWLGLLSVARLGGQRALGCGGAIIAQLPNLMRHRVRTAGNRSMGGRLILLPPQGWLIVRSRLEDPWFWKAHESERYVECATDTTLRRYLCRWGVGRS